MLSNISRNISICDPSATNLRLIIIFSRFAATDQRNAVRETWGAINHYKASSLYGNWSYFFLVGKPTNESDRELIETEMKTFGDVVSANVSEGYYLITYKLLVGLKIASCYCPKADYVIKTDDDTYLRIARLDYVINAQQLLADSEIDEEMNPEQNVQTNSSNNTSKINKKRSRIFTGAECSIRQVLRNNGLQSVSKNEYPDQKFPFFCFGALYIISMTSVHELAIDCPHHCTGQNESNFAQNLKKNCFTKLEDVFIGSCISFTQQSKTRKIPFGENLGIYIWNAKSKQKAKDVPAKEHIASHPHRKPQNMIDTHNFYSNEHVAYI